MKFKILFLVCALFPFLQAEKNPFPKILKRYSTSNGLLNLNNNLPPDSWFVQDLDHFNPGDTTKWKQRFFVTDEHFNGDKSGTVFLMIGGEGEASAEWMVSGQWIEYAKEFNALCFQLEHRFYGKSQPTSDMGIKNLAYLTSEQALADLGEFITSMNEKYGLNKDVKWIVFGGSYPGSLAAWMRMKYPHLVYGAVSSSGPLLAKVDFTDYYGVVVDALRTSSDQCVEDIKLGFKQLETLTQHRVGQRGLSKRFRLCDTIEGGSDLDISSLIESVASNFAGVVQYNKDNRIGKSARLANITIDVVCQYMTDKKGGSPVDRLATVNSLLLNTSDEKCLDYKYDNLINSYRNATWSATGAEGGRQWMFQTCNEFGFYQTSTGVSDVFTKNFPIEFFIKQCMDIFGAKYNAAYLNEAVKRTNMMYGGMDIITSRTVFIHGSIDPWHALGITSTLYNEAPAIYINGTAHCANMYPAKENDLPSLKEARELIDLILNKWLK